MFVEAVALGQLLAQHPRGPLTEGRGAARIDAITHGDDGIEVVMLQPTPDITLAVLANYRVFLDNCRRFEFIGLEEVFQVQTDIVYGRDDDGCYLGNRPPSA